MDDVFDDVIYCREDEICLKIKTTKICLPAEASDKMELENGEIAVVKAGWGEGQYPDAKGMRDMVAIQLEELNYKVTRTTYDFTSLAGEKYYKLEAQK
jgi:hypothetical protein